MTLFLIVLIVFLCIQTSKHLDYKAKSIEYNRRNKSNAKKQYDLSCETIRQMGKAYREGITQLTTKEFFQDSYGKLNTDWRYNEKNTLKNENYLEYRLEYQERMWVVATARACGMNPNRKSIGYLYNQGIWEAIPENYSEAFQIEWKNKYHLNLDDKQLKVLLQTSILLKKVILSDEENSNSYVAYNNPKALDYVAQKFNLPNNEEKCAIDSFPYESLQDLLFVYTCRNAKEEQYKHIPLSMICENPTEEQKKIQYKKCSYEENIYKKIQQKNDIIDKYDL